ncbi:hypothetical protein [Streptomyces griseoruber]|uniref:hypothetical protein n=1 Tax=Streptomyces griseoruber TaxID=1943 RepID=UPI0037B833B3
MTSVPTHQVPGPDGEPAQVTAGLTDTEEAHEPREPEAHEPAPREPGVEPGEHDDEPDAEPGEEQPERLPTLVIPDLRPYADPKAVVDLARRGARASREPARNAARRAGVALARAARRTLAELAFTALKALPGSVILFTLLVGWLTGVYGKKGSILARFGGVALALAVVAHTIAPSPLQGAIVLVWAWCMAAIMAAISAERGAFAALLKKAKGKQQKDAKKGDQPPANDVEKDPAKDADDAPTPRRKGLAGWLRKRSVPAGASTPDGTPDEEAAQDPAQDIHEPPLTALIRELIGNDNGVHLQVLRPAMRERFPDLAGATDQQLRKVLVEWDFDPSRTFRAGGVAGRAGVHRDQLPPLPSPSDGGRAETKRLSAPESASDLRVSPPTLRRSPGVKSGGERRRKVPEGWTPEDVERGYRWVNDAERGPSAWSIDRLDDQSNSERG